MLSSQKTTQLIEVLRPDFNNLLHSLRGSLIVEFQSFREVFIHIFQLKSFLRSKNTFNLQVVTNVSCLNLFEVSIPDLHDVGLLLYGLVFRKAELLFKVKIHIF